jgi:ubiquinone/menaquinone biosynthesis C-methylase UbiE
MSRSTTHPLLPHTGHSGTSRRLAVLASKQAIRRVLEKHMREDYQQSVLTQLPKPPESAEEISARVEALDSYRVWASANRASQDRMWSLLAEQIDEDYHRIEDVAAQLSARPEGSLHLSGGKEMPEYISRICIHGQPGGYMLERRADDLAAGLLYEAGGNLYAMGQGIGKRDSKGERLISHIRETYPDFRPRRILEMGCSAGGQSGDYPPAFPDAEFHALDVSPAMLRYAHVRAEALGATVHFHQADASETGFEDESFDLIISHNLFHEVEQSHMQKIADECYRLLAPGGMCIHQDVPIQAGRFDAFGQFLSEWQTEHNNEPFWMDFVHADLPGMLEKAGFDQKDISQEYLQAQDGPIPWYVVTAIKD